MTDQKIDYQDKPTERYGPSEITALVSGLALIALMFVPWFDWISGMRITTMNTGTTTTLGGDLSAWQYFGGMAYFFLVTSLLAIALALFRRSLPAGAGSIMSLVVAGLGLVLTGMTLWYIVLHPSVNIARGGGITLMDMKSAPVQGAYLGLGATLGIAVGGLLSFRSSRD